MKFSACWIVKNEAENIRSSMMSVKDCVGEMIVVDTGSTDYTIRIAKECGARVHHFTWINDFSAAKNYALSLAAGEYVIFLDADEFFSPALTQGDGENLLAIFEQTKADVIAVMRIEIEKKDGSVIEMNPYPRILRRAAIHYENKIHENPWLADGKFPQGVAAKEYKLFHTGYSKDLVKQKLRRNLDILETEQKRLSDPLKLYINTSYLMRESLFLEEYDQAALNCLYLLAHHQHCQEAYKNAPIGYLSHHYHAVNVVEMRRPKFNRQEVYDKLFGVVRELYAGTRDALLADLHYQLRFCYRDDRFLRELAAVEPALLEAPLEVLQASCPIEARIFEQAAEAAHLCGDTESCRRFAFRALECIPFLEERPLLLLLDSLKDHSTQAAGQILQALTVPGRPDIAGEVTTLLAKEDLCKELFNNAAPPDIFPPERLGIVGAKEAETEPGRIAFFRIKAEKLFAGMCYADIIDIPDADFAAAQDYICAYYTAYAQLKQGEYGKAYAAVLPHLKNGVVNQELLSLLWVTAEKAPEPLAAEARKLYHEYLALLNEGVDLSDIINTGVVYKAEPEKEKRALQDLTPAAFFSAYEHDKERPVTELLLATHEKAAAVCEKNGCVLRAAASYRLLLAKGREPAENRRNLERLLRESGNQELARQAAKIAQ
jgi:glycosyltransferase involved in cell wall biosynthesis